MNDNRLLRVMEDELGKARSKMRGAKQSAIEFGHYDDCGSDYRRDYSDAKALVEYLELLLPKLRAMIKSSKKGKQNDSE